MSSALPSRSRAPARAAPAPAAAALAVLAALACAWPAAAAFAQVLVRDVRVLAVPEATRVVLELSAAPGYQAFALEDPARYVVDLAGTRLARPAAQLPAGEGIVRGLRIAQRDSGELRLVLDLAGRTAARTTLAPPTAGFGHRLVIELPTPVPPVGAGAAGPTGAAGAPATAGAATARAAGGPTPGADSPPGPAAAGPSRAPAPGSAAAVAAAARPPAAADWAASAARTAGGERGTATARTAAAPGARGGRVAAPPAERRLPTPLARDLVVAVDAGHGGVDPGAIGRRGTREKDVTLAVARTLAARIDAEPGMRAVLTRTGDYFVPLRERIRRARVAQADLFLSVHADAVADRNVAGSSVYILSARGATSEAAKWLADRENAADLIGGVSLPKRDDMLASVLLDLSQSAAMSASMVAAEKVLNELNQVGEVRKSQVQQAGFVVLKSPDIPSMLIETAFITNPGDEDRLRDPRHQRRLAEAILSGVRTYFHENPPPGTRVAKLAASGEGGGGDERALRR